MMIRRILLRRRPLLARLARGLLHARDREPAARRFVELPEPVYRYAKGISEATGLPLSAVLESRPVRNLARAWERRVRVPLDEGPVGAPEPPVHRGKPGVAVEHQEGDRGGPGGEDHG